MTGAPVQLGDVLARKYRVDRILGQGNMGVVVAATHVELGQRVALKFMLGDTIGKDQRERFLREARAVVRLKSHHVARVLDMGVLENDAPYIVMEFLDGKDLAAVLAEGGPLPFDRAVEYVLQACEAVGEAHAAGIVHRDLKPANLFLTQDVGGLPCVKVLDFGISKLTGVEVALTQTQQAVGSPLYMSPEQMNAAKDIDGRSDIWSLGILLYQLVAGLSPYHAETVAELCARIFGGAPTPLAEFRKDSPHGFEAVILRCIQRDRAARFRNVAELAAALAPYAPARARVYAQRVARAVGLAEAPLIQPPEAPVGGTILLVASATRPSQPVVAVEASNLAQDEIAPVGMPPVRTAVLPVPANTAPAPLQVAGSTPVSVAQSASVGGMSAPMTAMMPRKSSAVPAIAVLLLLCAGGIGFAVFKLAGQDGSTEPSAVTAESAAAAPSSTAAPAVDPAVLPPTAPTVPVVSAVPAASAVSTVPAVSTASAVPAASAPRASAAPAVSTAPQASASPQPSASVATPPATVAKPQGDGFNRNFDE